MKQKERHHLKENELVHSLAAARDYVGARRRALTGAAIAVMVVVIALVGFVVVRDRMNAGAQELLASAMVVVDAPVQPPAPATPGENGKPGTPETQAPGTFPTEESKHRAAVPKLRAVIDQYPNSETAVVARYHLATTYAALGNHKEALAAYEDVITRAGDSVYGRMAKLGKATEQVKLGQYQPAIDTYKQLADDKDSDLPADAVLLQLARAYEASGNAAEAKKAFSRIVHEHPGSPYSAEAGKQIQ